MATVGSWKREWNDPNAIAHITYVILAVVF